MNYLKYILLLIFSYSTLLTQDVEIIVYTNIFTIDSVAPTISIDSPSHGDIYLHGDNIELIWTASDDSPGNNPMDLYASANLDDPYIELLSDFENNSYLSLTAPDFINSVFVSMRLDITDYYGNVSSSYSSGYFTIGNASEDEYDVITDNYSAEYNSTVFTIDTNEPILEWLYPNQSSYYNPMQGLAVRWESSDESMVNNPISIYFLADAGETTFTLMLSSKV